MKSTIIFVLPITKESVGFSQASNFIAKMTNKETLCGKEVEGIKSCIYRGKYENKNMSEHIIKNLKQLNAITKPEKLLTGVDTYEIAYCLLVEENSINDIVNLQYDFLLKMYFSDFSIFTILIKNWKLYFKASHYLYDLSLQNDKYYNSIYFQNEENKLSRLQKKDPGKLTGFVPLQFLDENNRKLFNKVNTMLKKETMKNILLGAEDDSYNDFPPSIRGCIELMKKAKKKFEGLNSDIWVKKIETDNILTFMLFAYSINDCVTNNKGDLSKEESINQLYLKIKECATCCHQLIENMILHSKTKSGVVSIRFHNNRTRYLKSRYGKNIQSNPYIEILITDYAGKNTSGNIAKNFMNKIKIKELKEKFNLFYPRDFLLQGVEGNNREKKIKEAFFEYYTYPEHIGKHFGLKIFRSIIEKNDGVFAFYSHSDHKNHIGENFHFEDEVQCIPGTGFAVLFPLKEMEKGTTRAEVSIDSNLMLQEHVKEYLNGYTICDYLLKEGAFSYQSQNEKDEMIRKLSLVLKRKRWVNQGKRHILYISAENLPSDSAEYICKALLIAEYSQDIQDTIFYNCSNEFVVNFQQTISVYFSMSEMEYAYKNREAVIALFTKKPIEGTFIVFGDYFRTLHINKISNYAGGRYQDLEWLLKNQYLYQENNKEWLDVPPYDILHEVMIDGSQQTLFEKYTLETLETDIQEKAFGCKISGTHMRLGSTIHIGDFYEAELLFSNRLYISRFAYLLIKEITQSEDFKQSRNITLYSYALYSELLVFEVVSILEVLYKEKNFDYAILERDSDHREFAHIDRIRYSKKFNSKKQQYDYFKERKVICIVPVNSTLKTNKKLISLFCENNIEFKITNIILNYSVVLVGSKEVNKYWKINEKNKTLSEIEMDFYPTPQYSILVKVDYNEAIKCNLCFPENVLEEVPLIEVNAASTIPNQSFGLYLDTVNNNEKLTYDLIEREEEKVAVLKEALIYSHIQRGENHFSYYFKTDKLFLVHKNKIADWLKGLSKKLSLQESEYHVLFCPSHFSNVGFLEYVNKYIFQEAALIIRTDVDKEYRSNMNAKHSNLTALIELLEDINEKEKIIKIHYIDDSIITGRTFYRAKSLISSVVGKSMKQSKNVDVHIFEKIFVLLDRNSKQNRLQYINCWDNKNKFEREVEFSFFAFVTLHISSMRSHGDSCILCKLEQESMILQQSAVTREMEAYWEIQRKKFSKKDLKNKKDLKDKEVELLDKTKGQDKKETAFRRMVCTHIASLVLDEKNHGNKKEIVVQKILELIYVDCKNRLQKQSREVSFEYFCSYLKVISRPFLVFNKAIKESIFDILLVLTESILNGKDITKIIKKANKKYLLKSTREFSEIETLMKDLVNEEKHKKDMILILFKQLTELKSNYFIRIENIQKLVKYINSFKNPEYKNMIYNRYLQQIKKLLGVSSDTSKSAWFNRVCCEKILCLSNSNQVLEKGIIEKLILENTRAYYDGISKLSKSIVFDEKELEFLNKRKWLWKEYNHFKSFHDKLKKDNKFIDREKIYDFLKKARCNGDVNVPGIEEAHLSKLSAEKVFNKKYELVCEKYFEEESERCELNIVKSLNKEVKEAQYRDFREILMDYQYLETKEQLTKDGAVSLAAGIELFNLCKTEKRSKDKEENENVEVVCFKVACLIQKILRAKEVRILLENPLECDKWEDTVKEKYNHIVKKHMNKKNKWLLEKDEKKEYLIIADSNISDLSTECVQTDIAHKLEKYQNRKENRTGYLVEEDYMIWEIGNKKNAHILIVFVEFYDLELPKDWQIIRNVMSMNFLLNHNLFGEKEIDYLYKFVIADKDRVMYNLDKAHSHTGMAVKNRQFTDVKAEKEPGKDYYKSYVLTLLSDLQVSKIYRMSLKDDFYCRALGTRNISWKKGFEIFSNHVSLIAIDQNHLEEDAYLNILVEINYEGKVEELLSESILCYDVCNDVDDVFLLIFSLVMNAAGVKRGLREEGECDKKMKVVKVNLTKTQEGNLRISNKCDTMQSDADQINDSLRYPPGMNQGISLWSISRYTRSLISILIAKSLEKAEKTLEDLRDEQKPEVLMKLKTHIQELLGEDFRVKVFYSEEDGINYFNMDIPILYGKYKKYDEF